MANSYLHTAPTISRNANFALTTAGFCMLAVARHLWFPDLFALSGLLAGWAGFGVLFFAESCGFHRRASTWPRRAVVLTAMLVGIGRAGALAAVFGLR